ncbi:cytochrome P450 [Trichocladium antarcticum]|uniref:Cytochrome P450 n=1 Tax=Trichocladium antarcticum TaxID=1450529 RepID=A0AAN6UNH2_9PEZI|nr:cytochrome P450 [Trichocladium antarcticum]
MPCRSWATPSSLPTTPRGSSAAHCKLSRKSNPQTRRGIPSHRPSHRFGLNRRRFGSVPFRLSVGLDSIFFIPYGEPIQAMFKNARDLSMKPIIVVAMRDQFGMPPADVAIYERDGSGGSAKPLDGWEHMDPAHRIFHSQHRDLHAMLNGASLEGMTARFMANYTARLRATAAVGDEWTELPDLFALLRTDMFHAACTSMVGERFFELNPDFCRDFWEFDGHVLTYLRRPPRWMAPRAFAVRTRLLESIKKWRQYAGRQFDAADPALAAAEYEPVWGARLMRVRADVFAKAGASPDGCASMDLGLLWAANANVIPATLWTLLGVLLSPDLAARVRAEMADCLDTDTDSFRVSALCSKPLLNGIHLESLRFCTAATSARNPVIDDFRICGWRIPRDALMLSISWFGAHDARFWNTGRTLPDGTPEHPVDAYWAERFLEYPDDPASGPVRKPAAASRRPAAKRTPAHDKTAKAISHTAALGGYFYPYGGGTRICPGRHLAKQEMLGAVAVMLREFEIELLDPAAAAKAGPDLSVFPTGALGPDRKLAVRMRRRRKEEAR